MWNSMEDYWNCIVRQDAERLRSFFEKDAVICWENTKETFGVDTFIRANCEYPGSWDFRIERREQTEDSEISITRVWRKDYKAYFHVVSFFKLKNGKISQLVEYWGDDGPVPEERWKQHYLGRTVYYSEDDFCQLELLPKGNLDFCKSEMEKIEQFGEEHQVGDEGGDGFTDIYLRESVPEELKEQKISEGDLSGLLAFLLPEYDYVETGYGDYRERCMFTRAYGKENGIVVFFNVSEGTVQNIWLELTLYTEGQREAAKETLAALGSRYELLLVDWNWPAAVELLNEKALETYLEQKLERGKKIAAMVSQNGKERKE